MFYAAPEDRAPIRIAPIPCCPVHGEGCDFYVLNEDLDWRLVGYAEGMRILNEGFPVVERQGGLA